MAQLTIQEFDDVIAILANHLSFDRFHERLVKANAVVSRKRPATVQALAAQLYQLSAGLRRAHPARYAVEVLWQDMLSKQVDEAQTKTLETLAERINACLTERLEIIPEKTADLLTALGAYYQALAVLTTEQVATLELLLRASTDVAEFFRQHEGELKMQNEQLKIENEEKSEKTEE